MKKIVIAYAFLIIILASFLLASCDSVRGESAYEIAVRNGFVGSEKEWLDSLKGDSGKDGSDGENGKNGLNGTGISLIETDSNGHIVITLDNGKIIDLGAIETPEKDTSTAAPVLNTKSVTLAPDSFWLLSANRPVRYKSSDTSVAQVTDNGIIIAHREGTATIYATTSDSQTAVCKVTVVNYTYRYLSDKTIEITGCFGSRQVLDIPSDIKGFSVTSIGDSAFKGCDFITSVIIPSTVTSIGAYAFADCSNLSSVKKPDTASYVASSFEGTPWLIAQQQNITFTDITPETVYSLAVGEISADIYSAPTADDSFKLSALETGVQLQRDGISYDTGWSRVKHNGSYAYIKTSRLTYNKFTEYTVETEIYPTNSNDQHIPGVKPNLYLEDKQVNGITPLTDGTPVKVLAVCYENEGEVFGWSYIQHENSYYFIRNSQLKCYMEQFNGSDTPPTDSDIPNGMKEIIAKDCSYPQGGTTYINTDNSEAELPSSDELDLIKVSSTKTSTEPLVLIVHTHGTEAFTEEGLLYFDPNTASRSNDPTKNVVALGKVIADALNEKGIVTLHCEIAFDAQDYDNAYARAAESIQQYLEEYPSIKYVIDIHRDTIDTSDGSGNRIKPVISVGDDTAAQVMFVVAAGNESEHPSWEANLALAQRLREEMHAAASGICRPTMLKDKDHFYNQQYSAFSILLEIGTDCNTLSEVTLSASLAAEAIAKTIIE